jgi:hypothetical protein
MTDGDKGAGKASGKDDKTRGVFLDGRQTFAGRVAALTKSLTKDLGDGVLTQTEQSLVSIAATLTARAEALQAALLRGEHVDDDTIVRVNNAAARMLDKLGVKIRRLGRNDAPAIAVPWTAEE